VAVEADSTSFPMMFNGPGPRMCLGKDVALYEIAMVLAMLAASDLEFALAGEPILDQREWSATIRMTGGLMVRVS